ncbi:ABC transporter permease [Piscibacillus halophilus]|uniref:ABC transporter permease n=1 Tax=Piscibacillus halophilus TaxID=571933 RepID=UPI00158A156C|nr:ABC transporter permease [Piscibacillus halophilus]
MIFKILLQQKWTLILLISAPILFIIIGYQFVDRTTDDIKVPVALVDPYEQNITEQLLSDMSTDESFNITHATSIPEEVLERGEVEAIFVLPEDLEGKIRAGELEGTIQWYRHERSVFDGLFKEQLASAIMTRAIRSEAANLVQRYQSDADWNDIYEYGLRYLEPEPIFQIQFESVQQQISQVNHDSEDWLLFRWLFWIFIWSILAFLTQLLLNWKEQNIFERLSTIGHANSLRKAWFFTFLVLLAILTVFTSVGIQTLWLSSYNWMTVAIDVGIVIFSLLIYYLLSFVIQKRETLWTIALTYGVSASVVFFLIQYNLLSFNWWFSIFLPSWILV